MQVNCRQFINEIKPFIRQMIYESKLPSIIDSISTDTRSMKKNDFFFALSGENFDALQFSAQIVNQGAACVICSPGDLSPFEASQTPVIVVEDVIPCLGKLSQLWALKCPAKRIAITGSAGKTTTKELLTYICQVQYNTLATCKNYNNQIGLPKTLFDLLPSHELAILELGTNHFGEIKQLTQICNPHVANILNIGAAHLAGLNDLDGVAREKGDLYRYSSPDTLITINLDDPRCAEIAAKLDNPKLSYSISNPAADVFIEKINSKWLPGAPPMTEIHMNYQGQPLKCTVPGGGQGFLYATLISTLLARHLNIPFSVIQNQINSFPGVKGRFQIKTLSPHLYLVDDTYNANPFSMSTSLVSFMTQFSNFSRIVVLGDMLELGKDENRLHFEMGKQLATLDPEFIFLVGSRSQFIWKGAISHGISREKIVYTKKYRPKDVLVKKILERIHQLPYKEPTALFLKASRGIALDEVVDALVSLLEHE